MPRPSFIWSRSRTLQLDVRVHDTNRIALRACAQPDYSVVGSLLDARDKYMDTVDYIKNSLAFAHRALADACNGTPEQLHFVPEHGSHSIAWCLWHTARIEDLIINGRARQAPQVWNEKWAERTGLPFEG